MSELAPRPENPDLIFVGGTGRSGTHVVSQLLATHPRYARVPIECRFHCNPQGFPDLLAGRVDVDSLPEEDEEVLVAADPRGRARPDRRQAARLGAQGPRPAQGRAARALRRRLAAFERDQARDLDRACRNLFLDLLWPLTEEQGKPGLIEMSCFTIAEGPTLQRLFPEAKLIHTVRDGRDAGSSKVSKRQKRSHPRDGFEGLRWWEGRLRNIERGVGELADPSKLLCVSLDDLVSGDREGVYERLREFPGLDDAAEMRSFFDQEMSAGAAHKERWREGLSRGRAGRAGRRLRVDAGAARARGLPLRAAAARRL